MRHELRRVEPLRAANVAAVVYGLVTAVFALILAPFFVLASLLAPAGEFGKAGPFFVVLLLCLYPLVGVAMGWISGLLTSAIYNLVVRWTGGLVFDLESGAPS